MDGGDGRHMAGCPQSSGKTIIDRVMTLRFRPIAPKPAAERDFPGGISPEKQAVRPAGKRVKRKYVRVRKDDNIEGRRNRSSVKGGQFGSEKATTLQLMPEKSEGQTSLGGGSGREVSVREDRDPPKSNGAPDRTAVGPPWPGKPLVESWVTVECVTDMCMDVRRLGRTDVERIKNLESDNCPAFVSDGAVKRVQWVNEAYRRMVLTAAGSHPADGGGRWPEVAVWLQILKANDSNKINNNDNKSKDKNLLDSTDVAGFTCRVRVEYHTRDAKEKCWKIMPCDVWRLDCGGFAWRLDVDAALSLAL